MERARNIRMAKKPRGPKKPGVLFLELAQQRGKPIRGDRYRYKFSDGSVEYLPRALVDSIGASQRGRLKGKESGALGGRFGRLGGRRPKISRQELRVMFADHLRRSGHSEVVARRSFRLELQKRGMSEGHARRLISAALGPMKEKRT